MSSGMVVQLEIRATVSTEVGGPNLAPQSRTGGERRPRRHACWAAFESLDLGANESVRRRARAPVAREIVRGVCRRPSRSRCPWSARPTCGLPNESPVDPHRPLPARTREHACTLSGVTRNGFGARPGVRPPSARHCRLVPSPAAAPAWARPAWRPPPIAAGGSPSSPDTRQHVFHCPVREVTRRGAPPNPSRVVRMTGMPESTVPHAASRALPPRNAPARHAGYCG